MELYNLKNDLSEVNDLSRQPARKEGGALQKVVDMVETDQGSHPTELNPDYQGR